MKTKPPKKLDWGQGPWAVPQPRRVPAKVLAVPPARPELEAMFDRQVRQHYGLMQQLRGPRRVMLVRGVLILVLLALWLVAIVFK